MRRLFWLQILQKGDEVLVVVNEIVHDWRWKKRGLQEGRRGSRRRGKATEKQVDCGEQKTYKVGFLSKKLAGRGAFDGVGGLSGYVDAPPYAYSLVLAGATKGWLILVQAVSDILWKWGIFGDWDLKGRLMSCPLMGISLQRSEARLW
jgi:hypothetical protein